MPLNPRLRNNSVFGSVDDSPLVAGATFMNSAGLTGLGVVAAKHAVITLDPLRQYGPPEIIIVTAHTAASSIATMTRGAYGTTARDHPQGTLWVHAPIAEDFTAIVTSATRPTDPYSGQMIFETDTNKFVARTTANVWQDVVALGQWQPWTPVISQGVTPTQTIQNARYTRIGRTIIAVGHVAITASGTAGQGVRLSGLPVDPAWAGMLVGTFRVFDSGVTNRQGSLIAVTTTSMEFIYDGDGNAWGIGTGTITNLDFVHVSLMYEAVS